MSSGLLLDIIIFGGIAALIIYRLISVLGKDLGHKKNSDESFINKRHEYYQQKTKAKNLVKKGKITQEKSASNQTSSVNTIDKTKLKRSVKPKAQKTAVDSQTINLAPLSNVSSKLTTSLSTKLKKSLQQLKEINPTFDVDPFCKSAAYAFELIYNSYVASEISKVKHLCSIDIYNNFSDSINNRKIKKERWFHQLVRIEHAQITKIILKDTIADITVAFSSVRSEAILNIDGKVISGSLGDNFKSKETWTFRRDLSSNNPIWLLIAL